MARKSKLVALTPLVLAEMRDLRHLPMDLWALVRDRSVAWCYGQARIGAIKVYRDAGRARVETTVNEHIAACRTEWHPGNPVKRQADQHP